MDIQILLLVLSIDLPVIKTDELETFLSKILAGAYVRELPDIIPYSAKVPMFLVKPSSSLSFHHVTPILRNIWETNPKDSNQQFLLQIAYWYSVALGHEPLLYQKQKFFTSKSSAIT